MKLMCYEFSSHKAIHSVLWVDEAQQPNYLCLRIRFFAESFCLINVTAVPNIITSLSALTCRMTRP